MMIVRQLEFGDGLYDFALKLPQIRAIEAQAGKGIGEVATALFSGTWHYETVIEVVRQGLIGGNACVVNGDGRPVEPYTANALIQSYVIDQPIQAKVELAQIIMTTALFGYEPVDDGQKKNSTASQEVNQVD
ncbi:MAG: gene transfer agent family protein [Shewanella sp.]